MDEVLAHGDWKTNADLIADVARLGYLDGWVLDATWGRGGFWRKWHAERITAHDLFTLDGVDFRHLPEYDETYDAVVFDPPYKLNGTPAENDMDNRYGTDVSTRWQARMASIREGAIECGRVTKVGGYLLVKVMDQVCSGRVRWQTDMVQAAMYAHGFEKADEFHFPSYRPQPAGRRQVHARRNFSTLSVYQKRWGLTAPLRRETMTEPTREDQ